jgi:putative transposase
MDAWAYAHGVRLDFIRQGRPTENAFIESFHRRLRDECLNVHVFGTVAEAQTILDGLAGRLQSRAAAQQPAR